MMNAISIIMSDERQKDFAPPRKEEEKPSMRDYKSKDEQEIAKERIEYAEVKPKNNVERTSTNNNNAKLNEKSDTEC
jgi:hypothetical protein